MKPAPHAPGETIMRIIQPAGRTRRATTGEFLRGPVPMAWLRHAVELGSAAVSAGIALWFVAGMSRSTEVEATHARLGRSIGVSPRTIMRGVEALEGAGLIRVVHRVGRGSRVVLVKTPNRVSNQEMA